MRVNDEIYDQFVSKIYHENEDGETETVELTFNVSDFESLDLRNGNNRGHRYYINDQKIPLEENDHYGTSSNGRVRTFKLTMVK